MERQLDEALKFEIQLQNLRHTPGATKEQIDLVEQRLERTEQKIEALREQQKKLRR